uniref:protein-glutamine gamma-glutamyltransferase n=1 Tax=Tetraodon nigroviridis TaxID=99883 RepID=H3CJT8_TETNG
SSINKPAHMTTDYHTELLVVRRGFEMFFKVTFSQPLTEADDFQMEFLIGKSPSSTKGSMVTVAFNSQSGVWPGQIVEMQGSVVTVSVTPATDAIVGRYRVYVNILTASGVIRSPKNSNTDLYLLFNAWCPDDVVFMANGSERNEYVLNDSGTIFVGSADDVSQRPWLYGTWYEDGILDACIYIMDAAKMPIWDRSKVLKVIRVGSAMINAQDDNGVLVGNWSQDFSMGTAPTAWTGSVKILLQYFTTGVPVCYAQCWVFAGVFNTFLRCLGIPARVVTNFNSAHDNTGNLKTDLIFHADGTPDSDSTTDSIWNYHVWNEVWMVRYDLPDGLAGWQVVDATPQETSDGYFRCGPASVNAIRSGYVYHPFDTSFVFAEVNSDIVYYKKDKYGNLTPYNVDTTHVGRCIYTKALSGSGPVDITHTYKHPEGSAEDKQAMAQAEQFGVQRDHSDIPEQPVKVTMQAKEVFLEQDIVLDIGFRNDGVLDTVVNAHLSGSVIYYTGAVANNLEDRKLTLTIMGNTVEHVKVMVPAHEYMPVLGSQLSLRFIVSLDADSQSAAAMKVVNLKTKNLDITISGVAVVDKDMYVTVTFTNRYSFALYNVFMYMEGSGVIDIKSHFNHVIHPGGTVTWKEACRPRLHGLRGIVAVLYCSSLCLYGYVVVNVSP